MWEENYKLIFLINTYTEIINSDKDVYGGSNLYNGLPLQAKKESKHNQEYSIDIVLAPLSITVLKKEEE